jgi:hypothetical protein
MNQVLAEQIKIKDLLQLSMDIDFGLYFYKDVLIVWDEDRDGRIFYAIDQITKQSDCTLLAAHESEGDLYLLWLGNIPNNFSVGEKIDVYNSDGAWEDCWNILRSESLRNLRK